jgi:ketosteroid isomerase-like protein
MTTLEVGKKLVELCKQGKDDQCLDLLYSNDIVAVEAAAMPNMPAEQRGKQAILGKAKWWRENHEVHSASVEGPWPHGDRFIVKFHYDLTSKLDGKRRTMDEAALYTVKDGKIVREEFFYITG